MATYDGNTGRFPVQTAGELDYVKNGNVYQRQATRSILVASESDLALQVGYPPGSIAHTAGFKAMWELGVNDTWISLMD